MPYARIITALAVSLSSTAFAADRERPEWQIPAHVEMVTDGDTVRVIAQPYPNMFYNDKVRLLALDTPEIDHAKCDHERAAGLAAKARAEALLNDQHVTLVLSGKRDSFGRLLAHVRLADGRDFSEIMVTEKYGRPELHTDWCKVLTAAAL